MAMHNQYDGHRDHGSYSHGVAPVFWQTEQAPFHSELSLQAATGFRTPYAIVENAAQRGLSSRGHLSTDGNIAGAFKWVGTLPPLYPEWLGNQAWTKQHGLRFAYVQGAMANGIATVELVETMARAGCLGFFGAAGLSYERVEAAVHQLKERLPDAPWGANLIHSPQEPELEAKVAELYIQSGVRYISAAAFMRLTPAIVRLSAAGLRTDAKGRIVRARHIFAKISRPEVAKRFMQPAPAKILKRLVEQGQLSEQEAQLAARIPVAQQYTIESDSGGHTDNQALGALFPSIARLRDTIHAEHAYDEPMILGAAGGIGTPQAAAAAFALGADYILTGSVNQGCLESGLSAIGKEMLGTIAAHDVTMAPAADMFELGVEVQVLKRGALFSQRAKRLYQWYKEHPSLDALDDAIVEALERDYFKQSLEQAWQSCAEFWNHRDPKQVHKADQDPKHKMALLFRAYLGLSSRWAIDGVQARSTDFQIWCGPAMGAFNKWVEGSFLQQVAHRTADQVALNLLEGACQVQRAMLIRQMGITVPNAAFDYRPRHLSSQAPADQTL